MATYLEGVEQFTFHADVLCDEVLDSEQSIQQGATFKAAVHRPNKLAGRIVSADNSRTLWYNGKTVTLYNQALGVTAQAEAPDTTGKALDNHMEKYNISMPFADFVSENIYENLLGDVDSAFLVGKAIVNGRSCDHIACSQNVIDWQIWIEDGVRRLPRQVVITYKMLPGAPQFMAQFSEWDLNARLPAFLFEANPPADAEKIEMLEITK
jgi:hypothetical protein